MKSPLATQQAPPKFSSLQVGHCSIVQSQVAHFSMVDVEMEKVINYYNSYSCTQIKVSSYVDEELSGTKVVTPMK